MKTSALDDNLLVIVFFLFFCLRLGVKVRTTHWLGSNFVFCFVLQDSRHALGQRKCPVAVLLYHLHAPPIRNCIVPVTVTPGRRSQFAI